VKLLTAAVPQEDLAVGRIERSWNPTRSLLGGNPCHVGVSLQEPPCQKLDALRRSQHCICRLHKIEGRRTTASVRPPLGFYYTFRFILSFRYRLEELFIQSITISIFLSRPCSSCPYPKTYAISDPHTGARTPSHSLLEPLAGTSYSVVTGKGTRCGFPLSHPRGLTSLSFTFTHYRHDDSGERAPSVRI
jgi:hypothetical protein